MKRVFAVMLLASALGCSSSSGGNHAVADASTDATGTTFGASACGQCVATSCATEITACNSAPDCQVYFSCLDMCGLGTDGNVDPTCASSCTPATSSAGQAAQSQLTTCRTTGAGASCSACGGSSDAGVEGGILHESCAPDVDASNACSKCLHEQCCDVREACLNDQDCSMLVDCESDCDDGVPDDAGPTSQPPDGGPYSCDEWCNAKANPSLDKWAQYIACADVLCLTASACGGNDACTTCVDTSCSAEFVALNGTPDGYLLAECFGQCATTDTACQSACMNAYPSVQSAFSSLGTCTEQHCPSCAN